MKSKLIVSIFLLSILNLGKAQDSTVILNTSMFDKDLQTIQLTNMNGWIFKQGNDTGWKRNELETAGWLRFNPNQLSAKIADNTGRMEGWFRIRFKLDSSFENMTVGIEAIRWAATDIYIDGNYIKSFGNTGLNGKPYEENRNLFTDIEPLQIEAGKDHILAVHVVDYINPFNHRLLKTESLGTGFSSWIVLTGPDAYKSATAIDRDNIAYLFLYSGVIGFLSVLFWFLYLQNKREKNLLFISISTSLFFTWPLSLIISSYPPDMDFNSWWLIFFIALQLWPIAMASMIYTVGEIFSFRYKKALVIFGILFIAVSVVGFYFNMFGLPDYALPLHPLLVVILLIYISVSSWKRLKGAQWAIVAGIVFTAVFSFTWAYSGKYESGEFLSLPVSLMIYVAMRFKEILREVEVNANQVVQLSEEKKEQALNQQKVLEEEVARQTIELRTSLENLKATQAQLIQSEKMASLGELTAGIAHEIQNPLNFVNNFSEVSNELINEMNEELDEGDIEEAKAIATDIKQNLEKINHHGKRADAIVKGMLQHSRTSSGQKELTDINTLCNEYLRLSYHGLRAKDKTFNAEFKTEFNESIGKINIVPQDIGRVLLNLINNAFYAVNEKKKNADGDYEPTVTVSTKKINGAIEINVKDNGNGIPESIKEKIFQPFFTTKPTGSGTGLGLSLSYDIVKAHGGNISIKSEEAGGCQFTIQIPEASMTK